MIFKQNHCVSCKGPKNQWDSEYGDWKHRNPDIDIRCYGVVKIRKALKSGQLFQEDIPMCEGSYLNATYICECCQNRVWYSEFIVEGFDHLCYECGFIQFNAVKNEGGIIGGDLN